MQVKLCNEIGGYDHQPSFNATGKIVAGNDIIDSLSTDPLYAAFATVLREKNLLEVL